MVRGKLGSVDSMYRLNGKGRNEKGRRKRMAERGLPVLVRLSDLPCFLV